MARANLGSAWVTGFFGAMLVFGQGCGGGELRTGTCKAHEDCATSEICIDGACYTVCNASQDCPSKVEVCDDGVCVANPDPECEADDDCDVSQEHCEEGLCVPWPLHCGNGALETNLGELCDTAIRAGEPGACPTSCTSTDPCEVDGRVEGATCWARCAFDVPEAGALDSCCPTDADANSDPDCAAVCGNGVVEPAGNESCDVGINAGMPGACPTTCASTDPCETNGDVAGTLCVAHCEFDQPAAGLVDGCCPDDGNANSDEDCSAVCGNGVVEGGRGEYCDTAIMTGLPGACPSECVTVDPCEPQFLTGTRCEARCETGAEPPNCRCGNGALDTGEDCDLGESLNDGSYGGCNPNCSFAPYCGDAEIYSGPQESCDDGNVDTGDGCNGTCSEEADWTCAGEPSVCSPTTDRLYDVVDTVGDGYSFEYAVVRASDGNLIVVWPDGRNGSPSDIYAQKYDRLLRPMWDAGDVMVYDPSLQTLDLSVCADHVGGAYVAWTNNVGGETVRVRAQHVQADGTLAWPSVGVLADDDAPDETDRMPACLGLVGGGMLVAWWDQDSDPIYFQRIDAAGSLALEAGGREAASSAAGRSSVRWSSDAAQANVYLSWRESVSGSPSTQRIHVMRMSSAGALQWSLGGIRATDSPTTHNTEAKHVGVISGSDLIVAWMDERDRQSAYFRSIYGQKLTPAGARQWTGDAVIDETGWVSSNNQYLVADSDGTSGMVISWVDARIHQVNDGQGRVMAQRISAAGARVWNADGVAVTSVSDEQRYHDMVSDGAGGAYLVWADSSDNNTFGQYIQADQTLAWGSSGLTEPDTVYKMDLRLVLDSTDRPVALWAIAFVGVDFDIRAFKKWTAP